MTIRDYFSWGSDDKSAAGAETPAPSNVGNVPVDAIALARAKVDESVSARKRGRPKSDSQSIGSDQQIIQAEIQRQLEACYEPKAWAALLALPADAALALTAREHWKIGKDERETLGAAGSAAARTLMITNPRSLAFLMLASALFSVYVPRAIQEIHHQQEARKQAAEKKPLKVV